MIKTLAKSIREYKTVSILTPTMVSLEVLLEVFIPFITSDLITYMQKSGGQMELSRIAIYGVVLVVMAMASLLSGMLSGKFCATASTGFAKNLRRDMYYRVQQYSFGNIDKFSTSSLITRMTTDVTNVQMAYMMIIRIAVRTPLMLICCIVMTFFVNVYMALIYLIVAPIVGLALFLIAFKVKPIFTKVFKKEFGTTPYASFLDRRIKAAKYLLRSTSRPVKEIALQLGWENPCYFARLFKRKTKMTPSEYRASSPPPMERSGYGAAEPGDRNGASTRK